MTAPRTDIIVIGRFPPPPDGQSMATLRLADQLGSTFAVHTVNTMIPAQTAVMAKIGHYRKAGDELAAMLARYPDATIVWTSISPEPAGHWRDVLTLFPHLRGRKVVAVAHWGTFARVFTHLLTRWTARRLIPGLHRTVFTAPVLADACAPWIPKGRRAVIPNTLDTAVIPDRDAVVDRIERGVRSTPRILFLSNMFVEKGWPDILEAAALMHDEGFRAEWLFAGAWPSESIHEDFLSQVDRLELGESVIHLGPVEARDQVAQQHLEADLFVLPSWLGEAQPLTIIEAMAAGTPCVVAGEGGMPDLIGWDAGPDDAAGEVIPPRRPASLAAAVMRVTEPVRWERAARLARHRFETLFAPDAVSGKWLDLLEDLT